jgi:hypothetical protein
MGRGGAQIWISTAISTSLYVFYGVFGAMAYPHLASGNILSVMAHDETPVFIKLSIYVFSISVIGFGIPLFAVVMRSVPASALPLPALCLCPNACVLRAACPPLHHSLTLTHLCVCV